MGKETTKNYFSNKKAFIISFIIPIIAGLIIGLFALKEFIPVFLAGALVSAVGIIPLEGLIALILKFKKNKESYDSRYMSLKGTLILICFPLVIHLLIISLINERPIHSLDDFIIQYYYNSRSILFIMGSVFVSILNFLCLTKRIKYRWLILWFIFLFFVALNGQQVDYVPRYE